MEALVPYLIPKLQIRYLLICDPNQEMTMSIQRIEVDNRRKEDKYEYYIDTFICKIQHSLDTWLIDVQ